MSRIVATETDRGRVSSAGQWAGVYPYFLACARDTFDYMTALDSKFIEAARGKPYEFQHGTHVVFFTADETESTVGKEPTRAILAVTMGDRLIGYVTPSRHDGSGIVSVDEFGKAAPKHFRTLEGAVEQLLPGVADGLEGHPTL